MFFSCLLYLAVYFPGDSVSRLCTSIKLIIDLNKSMAVFYLKQCAVQTHLSFTCIFHSHCLACCAFIFRFSKQNMLMWGIWQGKGKPPFNVYFEPFATQMAKLYNDGE